MGYRREPLAPGEWYHCYTRGIDGRVTFETLRDYERFIEALYIHNSEKIIERGHFQHKTHQEILSTERGNPLVAIGAYALMTNHFHLLLKEVEDGGITKFMHRVGTGYAMYFNAKKERIGGLFVKPFRSKHVSTDGYLDKIVQYIHLNPIEIFEPKWKEGKVDDLKRLAMHISSYPYSSLPDYLSTSRLEGNLLAWSEIDDMLIDHMPPLGKLLPEMREYHASISMEKS